MKNAILLSVLWMLFSDSARSWSWGRHGHEIIGQTAAMLVSTEPNMKFLGWYSFDFGVYNNLPDLVWKRPETYEAERYEHYLDLEVFDRAFKAKPEVEDPFSLSRKELETKFPELPLTAGRALWRIREMEADLAKITIELRQLPEAKGPARRSLQEKWILQAGILGHYIADLSQPLHTSENHDGQFSNQQGIHRYFEELCVDELFPGLFAEVYREAQKRWPKFHKENEKKSLTEMVLALARDSNGKIKQLLDIDRRNKRENLKKSAKAYHGLIAERLVLSSLYLAEVYRRNVGFPVDDERFYFFEGKPAHIKPAEGALRPAQSVAPEKVK
jgi:hypothetical protein